VLERLGGSQAAGAGSGGIAVPGRVGAEVALPRSHLVEAAHGELILAHEGMGPWRGAVWVSGRTWCGLILFFHEEVLAFEFRLGVGSSRGGLASDCNSR